MRNSIRSWRACPMWLWGLLVCAKPGNPNPQHAHWWLHTLLGEIKCRKSSFSGFLMIFLEILSNFSRYQQGIDLPGASGGHCGSAGAPGAPRWSPDGVEENIHWGVLGHEPLALKTGRHP